MRRTASATLGSVATRKAPSGRLTIEIHAEHRAGVVDAGSAHGDQNIRFFFEHRLRMGKSNDLAREFWRGLRPEGRDPDQHVGIGERGVGRVERTVMRADLPAHGGAQRIAEPPEHELVGADDVVAPAEREHAGAGGDVQRVDEGRRALRHQIAIGKGGAIPGHHGVMGVAQAVGERHQRLDRHAAEAGARRDASRREAGQRLQHGNEIGGGDVQDIGTRQLALRLLARRTTDEHDLARRAGEERIGGEEALEQPAPGRARVVADDQQQVAAVAHLGQRGRQPAGALDRGVVPEQALGGVVVQHAAEAHGEVDQRPRPRHVRTEPADQRRPRLGQDPLCSLGRLVEARRCAGHAGGAVGDVEPLQQPRRFRADIAAGTDRAALHLHRQVVATQPAEAAGHVVDRLGGSLGHRSVTVQSYLM